MVKYIQPCEHKPFVLKTFNLCEKCGEALHHSTNEPLGYPSNYIQLNDNGADWKRAVKEAKRDRGHLGSFYRWKQAHEKRYYYELGWLSCTAFLSLMYFISTR